MPRARDPNRDKARELYIKNDGFITNREIANTLGADEKIVAVWKQRDKWNDNVVQQSKPSKESCTTKNNKAKKKPIAKEVEQVMNNPELTDKQRAFCLIFVKCFNATKAYQKAYGCSYETAAASGARLIENVKIKAEIRQLKQHKLNQAFLEPADIFQKYMDIAFSDITDYVTFGTREIELSNDEGMTATTEQSYVDINPSWMVDGTLITEVSQGKEGIKIKLADRMKALEWLTGHMNMASEEQRLRIKKLQFEVSQISGSEKDQTGIQDFIKATKPTEEDIKAIFADEEEVNADDQDAVKED